MPEQGDQHGSGAGEPLTPLLLGPQRTAVPTVLDHDAEQRPATPQVSREEVRKDPPGCATLVSVVPEAEVHSRGRTSRAPLHRQELRSFVVKEILHWSVVLRRPLRETVAYAQPESVDLRELIEPVQLGSDTTEPLPPQSSLEPQPWIEFEVIDSRGRRVSQFRASMTSGSDARASKVEGAVVRHDGLPSDSPASIVLEADPRPPTP